MLVHPNIETNDNESVISSLTNLTNTTANTHDTHVKPTHATHQKSPVHEKSLNNHLMDKFTNSSSSTTRTVIIYVLQIILFVVAFYLSWRWNKNESTGLRVFYALFAGLFGIIYIIFFYGIGHGLKLDRPYYYPPGYNSTNTKSPQNPFLKGGCKDKKNKNKK
jgi:hypothetical protein